MDTLPLRVLRSNLSHAGVYIITNTVNGHCYIGSSYNMWRRWKEHRSALNRGVGENSHLQRAWNLYGSDAFAIAALECIEDRSQLISTEQKYLDELQPEYNIRKRADRHEGIARSPETRAKISAALTGRTYSEEYKAHLSEIFKGRVFSDKHRQNLKEAWNHREVSDEEKANFQERMNSPEIAAKRNTAIRGKKRTPEQRQKFSEAHAKEKGRPISHLNTPEVIARRNAAIAQYHADVAAGKRPPRTQGKVVESNRKKAQNHLGMHDHTLWSEEM